MGKLHAKQYSHIFFQTGELEVFRASEFDQTHFKASTADDVMTCFKSQKHESMHSYTEVETAQNETSLSVTVTSLTQNCPANNYISKTVSVLTPQYQEHYVAKRIRGT